MDDRLQALYARYRGALPERLARLDALRVEAQAGDEDALKAFVTDIHKLAGTAGSFGFEDLGLACAALENALRDVGLAGCESAMQAWLHAVAPYRVPAEPV